MPDQQAPVTAAAPASEQLALADQQLSLEEFCTRRSRVDRRVELLGAFFADETRKQHIKDTESAFAARLDAFANQPA